MSVARRISRPKVGGIYRDLLNRSFIVIKSESRVLIEYADGELRGIPPNEWNKLRPRAAAF